MELLRDRGAELEAAGVDPLGISRDSAWTHVAWRQALDLQFALLSDWNAEAVHGFGVAQEYRGLTDVAERSAFLVDTQGVVRGAWRYGTSEVPDLDELVAAARGLNLSDGSV
jgi:peroxiredoxin